MATELAKAYVQIVPSAKGIAGSISEALGGESEKAGKSAGLNIAGAIKKAIAAAGIGTAIKSALTEGANLQQTMGGVETLFKDSADRVKQDAAEAYKTAGLSANEYMEQVTSFSARLLQGLGGDTKEAATAAKQAVIDMADNANKFGTDIQSIQNAYQGFAKANYTMLDNLKLGYGGTKEEMARLLEDAAKLQGLEGFDAAFRYDLNNFNDIIEAIHVIQENLGVTGTTALEASETFSGSLSAMKAATANFLGDLTLGEDVGPALQALSDTVGTFITENLFPMMGNLIQGVFSDSMIGAIPTAIEGAVSVVKEIANGIVENLPTIGKSALEALLTVGETIVDHVDDLVDSAVSIVTALAEFIGDALPILIEKTPEILVALVTGIIRNLPKLAEASLNIISSLGEGLLEGLATLSDMGAELFNAVKDGFMGVVSKAAEWGKDLIKNFTDGIKSKWKDLQSGVAGVAQTVKDYMGFSEPKTGPLSNFHTFAPDMMDLFVEGIRGGMGNVREVVGNVAGIVRNGLESPSYQLAVGAEGDALTRRGAGIGDVIASMANMVQETSGAGGVIDVTLTIDGAVLARNQYAYNRQEVRRMGNPLVSEVS